MGVPTCVPRVQSGPPSHKSGLDLFFKEMNSLAVDPKERMHLFPRPHFSQVSSPAPYTVRAFLWLSW